MDNKKNSKGKRIAIIRVKGLMKLQQGIKDTFQMLNLHCQNHCVVVESTPVIEGMIKKIKDFATWGEIDEETYKLLKEGRDAGKKFFALAPPRKGYGRKGVKLPFNVSGALGYRGEKINDLIKRMV